MTNDSNHDVGQGRCVFSMMFCPQASTYIKFTTNKTPSTTPYTFRMPKFTHHILSLSLLVLPFMSQAFAPASVNTRTMSFQPKHRYESLEVTNLSRSSSSKQHIQQSTATSLGLVEGPQEAWTAYNEALEANPLLIKSVTASVILGAADLAGQALENAQKEDDSSGVDLARTARFAFFGLVLQAPWNHFYYLMLDGAIPPTEEPFTPTTGIKVVIDQFVQAPIFTVLIFAFLGFLEGKSTEAIKEQLNDDYADTMVANWKLWVPATVVNLAFVPPILRVLYLNVVFFFWSIFLSLKLNKDATTEDV